MTDTDNIPEKLNKKNDDLLSSTIGDFGKWQLKISILMALLKFPIAWFTLSIVFLAPPTTFWCNPPSGNLNGTNEDWIRFMERSNITRKNEGLNSGYCEMMDQNNYENKTITCQNGYGYNRSIFRSSIVTEWDLICGRQRLIDLSQITLMMGVLIGNILFGILADKHGRKRILIICIFLESIFGISTAFVPYFWGFIALRFLLAVANGGIIVTSFVMCMEIVGGKWRTIVPILYQIPFGLGNSIMSGLAYMFRDWRDFQLALSILSALYIVYVWCVPESPRWLLAVGKREEAMSILQHAAIYNQKDPNTVTAAMTELSNAPPENKKGSISTLFTTRFLRNRSIILCLNWTIVGITFFAFSQYVGNVGRNLYFTAAVGGLIALPGTFLCVYVVGRCGRRWTIACSHILTAVCFLAILTVPKGMYREDWPRVAFAGLGIVGMSISMPALYLFTGELFPTTLRNAGVGASVMFSRIGSMVAPLIIALQEVCSTLPLLILAAGAIIEAILVLPLPETKGISLPETVVDLENSRINKLHNINESYISVPQVSKEVDED